MLGYHTGYVHVQSVIAFACAFDGFLLVFCIHRFYSAGSHFHRMLHLLSNEIMLKARDIVGEDILDDPEMVNTLH